MFIKIINKIKITKYKLPASCKVSSNTFFYISISFSRRLAGHEGANSGHFQRPGITKPGTVRVKFALSCMVRIERPLPLAAHKPQIPEAS